MLCTPKIFPLDPLYNYAERVRVVATIPDPIADLEQKLTESGKAAFSRIFFILDKDHNGILSGTEFHAFVEQFFGASVPSFIDDIARSEDIAVYVNDFLAIIKTLIRQGFYTDIWGILTAFDYNSKLVVNDDDIMHQSVEKCTAEELLELSPYGLQVLSTFFKIFDKPETGKLSKAQIDAAFFIASINPFQAIAHDYADVCESENGALTLDAWLALWSLVTIQNPYALLRTLNRWGVAYSDLKRVLAKKKKRRYRKEDFPSTLQCYIFGAPKSGKTSILRSFVKHDWTVPYEATKKRQSFVNRVAMKQETYFLIVSLRCHLPAGADTVQITEFEYSEIGNVLKSEELMSHCDVACLIYDRHDKYSFSHIAYVQKNLDKSIPCVYIPTKQDLEIVEQEHEVTPNEFCEALGFPWPPTQLSLVSDSKQKVRSIFQEITHAALNP